jgi:hypothetical protein
VNWPFLIVAPEANNFSLPVDERRIDPSNGAPSKVTVPETSSRSLRGPHPTASVQTKMISDSPPAAVACVDLARVCCSMSGRESLVRAVFSS